MNEHVLATLESAPNSNAAKIAKLMGLGSKRDVNPTLYALERAGLAEKTDDGGAPLWRKVNGASDRSKTLDISRLKAPRSKRVSSDESTPKVAETKRAEKMGARVMNDVFDSDSD